MTGNVMFVLNTLIFRLVYRGKHNSTALGGFQNIFVMFPAHTHNHRRWWGGRDTNALNYRQTPKHTCEVKSRNVESKLLMHKNHTHIYSVRKEHTCAHTHFHVHAQRDKRSCEEMSFALAY